MRVMLLAPEYPGLGPSHGVGAYIEVQARALAVAGVEVLILAVTPAGCFRLGPGAAPERVAAAARPGLLRPLAAREVVARVTDAWDPEVIEAPNWGGLGALVGGGRARVARLSTPVSEIRAPSALRRVAARGHHAWEALSVRRAHALIANSQAMARLGERVYGRAADAVIAHAWDGVSEPPRADAGEEVLCVGRLEHRKGTDVLLEAWAEVARARPLARLHLVGADADGFGAAALARARPERVQLHGRLDDAALAALRRRCRIQVVPSRFESFGLVVLEAWGAGLAVIAADRGGLAEVVGDAGLLASPEDPAALAAAIAGLLADPARRFGLARAGGERLRARFAPAALAGETIGAYRLALARAGGSGTAPRRR